MVAPGGGGGGCVVALGVGGHDWFLPGRGHVWLLQGEGACMVALGGMHGCSQGVCMVAWGVCMVASGACMVALGGGHAWLLQGACVVAPRGMCIVTGVGGGGMHGFCDMLQ